MEYSQKYVVYSFSILLLLLSNCKKEPLTLEDRIFEINKETLYASAADKTKEKNESQWVAVLYTNLFQKSLSSNDLYQAGQCIFAIGDKELTREVIISNFMNHTSPSPVIPSNSFMRDSTEKFIIEAFERFLIRTPTVAEKTYFKNFISSNSNITAEIVYFSFALSKEYLFY